MKIVFFANTDWYLYNFRRALIQAAADDGHTVCLVCPPGEYVSSLRELGFRVVEMPFETGGLGPISNINLFMRVRKLLRDEQPDLIHNFTIKCVLFGGAAARQMGIARVNAITGRGHVFQHHGLLMRMIRPLVKMIYRLACRGKKVRIIFQNEDDKGYFEKLGMVNARKTTLIRGSGANCDRFHPRGHVPSDGPCRVLFASRLLREKGVEELIEAARRLKAKGVAFELLLAGDLFPGNPTSLTEADLTAFEQMGLGRLLGHVDDMVPVFNNADIVVLPSYHKGTPRVLLEAGASGLPLVATDIEGCLWA